MSVAAARTGINYASTLVRGAANLIVFIGPDGTGKSTLSRAIADELGPRGVWVPMQRGQDWWREINASFLDVNLWIRARREARRPGVRRKALAVAAHSLEYVEQHVRLARVLAAAGDGRVVLSDSYAWGPVIRWRPGKGVPFRWTKACAALFPVPRLVVLCAGDPESIWRRKPDMLPETIAYTIDAYRKYLQARRLSFLELDTVSEDVQTSTRRVLEAVGRWTGDRPPGSTPR